MKKWTLLFAALLFSAGCASAPSKAVLENIQTTESPPATQQRLMDTRVLTQADFNGSGLSKERDLIHPQEDTFTVQINRDVPVYTFHVVAYSTSTGAHGYIDIFRGEGTEPSVQMIPLDPNAFLAYEVARYFNVQDINFDGFLDIGVLVDGGLLWGAYQYWVFDPITGMFHVSPATQEFRQITFNTFFLDTKKQEIVTKNFLGAVGGFERLYRFTQGHWVLLQEHSQENRLRDEMQSTSTSPVFDCLIMDTIYVGKKPQTTTRVAHHECDAKGKGYF